MDSGNEENKEGRLMQKCEEIKGKMLKAIKVIKKVGKDDPRRIIHSMKVGLTLTLASFFFYFKPFYDGFEGEGMWAILTTIVVFEFTVGGTLSKSLNRGGATLVAAALGVGAQYLASLGGQKAELCILPFLIFILATASTFSRFLPRVRRRYDYGLLIFILTFTLVVVSGYRIENTKLMQLARQRLTTILIGGLMAIIISISISPVWAGADLHHLLAANMQTLASFLDAFGGEFFGVRDGRKEEEDRVLLCYKHVINSKAMEESLANFAWWEPRHGRFRFRHPWQQYIKIGALTRECATQIQTLADQINSTPKVESQLGKKIQEPCTIMSRESGRALSELASTLKSMKSPSPAVEIHILNSKAAAKQLSTMLENFSLAKNDLPEIMQLFVVSSTLMEIIESIDKISISLSQLSQKAGFRKAKAAVQPCDDIPECKETIVIDILVPHSDSAE